MPAVPFPTNNALIDGIANWAGNNVVKLVRLYSVKGGWEGWAQAELCMEIPLWPGLGGQCSREDTEVFTNHDRADLLHENPWTGKKIIELKCQSSGQDVANIQGFATAYAIDAGKIQTGNRRAAHNTATDTWYVIGIAPSDSGDGGAVEAAKARFSQPNWAYRNSTHWTRRDQNSPWIFWTIY
ncbi:hypothetical protein QBC37DRAFT_453301 [Rhypophila decipiens]|uniref:Uncharacterized protein n=1 Tax=Rhypophila decipiens TaxID=261697 RepID=A0AAN6XWR8_9PEZI|nr:hypothetical protein QBC37DRAFT_453301 [Rhypophila decipiens]